MNYTCAAVINGQFSCLMYTIGAFAPEERFHSGGSSVHTAGTGNDFSSSNPFWEDNISSYFRVGSVM